MCSDNIISYLERMDLREFWCCLYGCATHSHGFSFLTSFFYQLEFRLFFFRFFAFFLANLIYRINVYLVLFAQALEGKNYNQSQIKTEAKKKIRIKKSCILVNSAREKKPERNIRTISSRTRWIENIYIIIAE